MEVFRRNAQLHIADMRKEGLGDASPTSRFVSGAPDALLATICLAVNRVSKTLYADSYLSNNEGEDRLTTHCMSRNARICKLLASSSLRHPIDAG